MNFLVNQRGNALILVLSASAFLAVIALEMYRRGEVTARRSQQAQFKDETKVIVEAIASNLQNPETCARMLYDRVIEPGAEARVALSYKYEPLLNPSETTIEDGREVVNGIVAEYVALFTPGLPDMSTKTWEAGEVRRYRASLRTVFRSSDSNQLASVNYRTDIVGNDFGLPFYVWVDASNRIKSCFGINSAGTACNMALGYYHTENPAGAQMPQNLSCRQTVFHSGNLNPSPPGFLHNGACRYHGLSPRDSCPIDGVVSGPVYAVTIQDGSFGYPNMDACHQCE